MATDTAAGIGIRQHFAGLAGGRNFERSGTVQYKSQRQPLNFRGTKYNVGDTLPFDVGSPLSSYSTVALAELHRYWEQGFISPIS